MPLSFLILLAALAAAVANAGSLTATCRQYALQQGCKYQEPLFHVLDHTCSLAPGAELQCLTKCCGPKTTGVTFTVSSSPAQKACPVCLDFVLGRGCGFGMDPAPDYETLTCSDAAECRQTCCAKPTDQCSGSLICPDGTMFLPQAGCPHGAVDCRVARCLPLTTCAYVYYPGGQHRIADMEEAQCSLDVCLDYCCEADDTCGSYAAEYTCDSDDAFVGKVDVVCGDPDAGGRICCE